jgi:hypothetical protein
MKTLLAFFAGCLVTTVAVVLAGGYHAGMIVLGGILMAVALLVVGRMCGVTRIVRWLLALQNANSETVYPVRRANAQKPLAVIDRPRRAPTTRNSQRIKNVVALPSVLAPVQQDVMSALVNLRMPFAQAEKAVIEAYRVGDSFEDLFKRALPPKSRAA